MREQILQAAEQMVQDRGLEAVSFQQLADAVGLSKATVFHHFRSKDVLTSALIERCHSTDYEQYTRVLQRNKTAPKKLRRIAKIYDKALVENKLCLVASLGKSASGLSADLRAELASAGQSTLHVLTEIFEQGDVEGTLDFAGKAPTAAFAFLSLLQGAQHLARFSGDSSMFMRSVDAYLKQIVV